MALYMYTLLKKLKVGYESARAIDYMKFYKQKYLLTIVYMCRQGPVRSLTR